MLMERAEDDGNRFAVRVRDGGERGGNAVEPAEELLMRFTAGQHRFDGALGHVMAVTAEGERVGGMPAERVDGAHVEGSKHFVSDGFGSESVEIAVPVQLDATQVVAPHSRVGTGHRMHIGVGMLADYVAGFVLMAEHGEFARCAVQCVKQRASLGIEIVIHRL